MNYEQIWLTGFMATGKSRIGAAAGGRARLEAVDIDTLIEEQAGDTIPEIFARAARRRSGRSRREVDRARRRR